MQHELVGDTLNVERDPKTGAAKGIVGRCTCGWSTGYRPTRMTATIAFDEHFEKATGKERR